MDRPSVPGLIAGDLASAAISAAFVAPVVTAIDRAVVENGLPGRKSIGQLAACAITTPHRFFRHRPRLLVIVWTLYATTYAAANTSETVTEDVFHETDAATVGMATFLSTLTVNTPLGLWKDVRFTQTYGMAVRAATAAVSTAGTRAASSSRSYSTLAAFLLRDAITVFGTFALAPHMASAIPDSLATHTHIAKDTWSQLLLPSLTQIFATPMHRLGLDFYSRPHVPTWRDRVQGCTHRLVSTTAMRCLRILPAFGFGCVGNTALRRHFRGDEGGRVGNGEDGRIGVGVGCLFSM